jgi:hypothetical protein
MRKFAWVTALVLNLWSYNVDAQSPPAPATAAGFTTLAFDGDFEKGLDLGCWPNADGAKHTWYQGIWYAGGYTVPCDRIKLMVDAVARKQVVDLTYKAGDVATYGATVLSTINQGHNLVTDFPSGYYETVFRVQTTPDVVGLGGLWWNTWMWGTKQVQVDQSVQVVEHDIMEQHGQSPTWITSGCINWGHGGPGYDCGYNYADFVGGFDYRQYHKFGYLITNDGTKMTVCGYLDDVFKGCTDPKATGDELTQRNFLIASVGWGCNFTNGYGDCTNRALSNVYSCPSPYTGQICFSVVSSPCCGTTLDYETNNQLAYISEVQGIPNVNGVWQVTALDPWPGPRTQWVLLGSKFSGAWTPGTGVLNKYQQIDMYLQSWRVWSCADWKTTMCFTQANSPPPPPPPPSVGIGARVYLNSDSPVYRKANNNQVQCLAPAGSRGVVTDGANRNRWNVNFDTVCDGWVDSSRLLVQ